MDTGKMKNMVVLKDLPSNLIDEAIIILKPNKKIKSFDYVKNNESGQDKQGADKANKKDYIIDEAQMVIANYISNLEGQRNMSNKNIKSIENKYKMLKTCTIVLSVLFILNAILKFFKI